VEALALESPSAGVTVLRLSRAKQLNAINEVMADELVEAFDSLSADTSTRVVVLTGEGRGFCSGLDVRNFGASMPADDAPAIEALTHQERMASLPVRLRDLPQPVIAAVNGPAVGGGFALALASDIRLCSTSATFGNGAIHLGLTGGEMGLSYLLPRAVGSTVASEWMLTGRMIEAAEAERRGLVSEVLEPHALLDRALALATTIASFPGLSTRLTKRTIQANIDAPDLWTAMELENRNQLITFATPESAARRKP
jgi:enoyl-CoA hydratase/carnithine racemase